MQSGSAEQNRPQRHIGLIKSVLKLDDGSGSVLWRTTNGTWRAHVPLGIAPADPRPGQVWEFAGAGLRHPTYGEQWRVTQGARCMPTVALAIPFLCHHVPGLTEHRASRWLARWQASLLDLLVAGDVQSLAAALGGPLAGHHAQQAVTIWQTHARQFDLSMAMGHVDGSDLLAQKLLDHFGDAALDRLIDDPYVLLAFTSFPLTDRVACQLGITAQDPRRLRGAVEAAIHQCEANGRKVIAETELQRTAMALLNTGPDDATEAIRWASLHGRIVPCGKDVWLSDGMARKLAFIVHKLVQLSRSGIETPPEPSHPATITAAVHHAMGPRLSRASCTSQSKRVEFLAALIGLAETQGMSTRLIAGSALLAGYLGDRLGREVHDSSRSSPLADMRTGSAPCIVVWISSTQCIDTFARVLAGVSDVDRLLLVDDGSARVGLGSVAQFVAQCGVIAQVLPADAVVELDDEKQANRLLDGLEPYSPRHPDRTGTFSIRVAPMEIEQAMVGLCYRYLSRGTVALVLSGHDARESFAARWRQQVTGLHTDASNGSLAIVSESELEPGDACTVIYPVFSCGGTAADWQSVRGIGRSRTIVIMADDTSMQADCGEASDQLALVEIGRRWVRRQQIDLRESCDGGQ